MVILDIRIAKGLNRIKDGKEDVKSWEPNFPQRWRALKLREEHGIEIKK